MISAKTSLLIYKRIVFFLIRRGREDMNFGDTLIFILPDVVLKRVSESRQAEYFKSLLISL